MFRVQARPGLRLVEPTPRRARRDVAMNSFFTFYELGFPATHLGLQGLGQGFKGYKMLISITLNSTVWIGHFHPLGEAAL